MREKLTWTDEADIERAKLAAAREELSTITDTDRIDALITLFGGHYAFPVMWQVAELFQNGRSGLDAFLNANPSLLPAGKDVNGGDSNTRPNQAPRQLT